jgi:hypothetical protein
LYPNYINLFKLMTTGFNKSTFYIFNTKQLELAGFFLERERERERERDGQAYTLI